MSLNSPILTSFVYPPTPVRDHDWCAYHDGDEEYGSWYGWGATEEEALADLAVVDEGRREEEEAATAKVRAMFAASLEGALS